MDEAAENFNQLELIGRYSMTYTRVNEARFFEAFL